MLHHTMTNRLADLLALARAAALSVESMLMPGRRPVMVPVSVSRRRATAICAPGYGAANGIFGTGNGIDAHAAVRMHDTPVINGWRKLDVGTTPTGKTGHSQPSTSGP